METFLLAIGFIAAWPILFSIGFAVLILSLLYSEHEVFSTIFVIAAAVVGFFTLKHLGQTFTVSQLATYVGIYFVAGFIFTLPKWWIWAQRMGRKFNERRKDFPNIIGDRHRMKTNFIEKYVEGKLTEEERETLDKADRNTRGLSDRFLPGTSAAEALAILKTKRTSLIAEAETAWEEHSRGEPFIEDWNNYQSKGVMKVRLDETNHAKVEVFYEKPALVGYLTSWIINWPFYALLLVLEDFISELVNWFADHVGKTFRNIATRAFNPAV